jgi:hypothetical protein
MRSIQERASEASQNLIQRMEEEKQTYLNSKSEEFKQDYWDKQICWSWWHSDSEDFPINFSEYRKHHLHIEPNIDRFIPWMMAALEDLWFSWTLEDIFILDEPAQHYLRVHSLTANNSQAVWWIISQTEQQFVELAEKVGDLLYDGLAEVLEWLSQTITPTVSVHIIQAKQHASTAWEICKPFISKKTNPKHKTNVAGMDNKTLWDRVGKLDNATLKSLLGLLWNKIHTDGLADQGRWRKKLATELFSCSESILNASKEL